MRGFLNMYFLSFLFCLSFFISVRPGGHFFLKGVLFPVSPISSQWSFPLHCSQKTNSNVTSSFTFLHIWVRILRLLRPKGKRSNFTCSVVIFYFVTSGVSRFFSLLPLFKGDGIELFLLMMIFAGPLLCVTFLIL